jgi:hypothetical protein
MMVLIAFFLVLQPQVVVAVVRIQAGVPPMVEVVVLAEVLRMLELPVLELQVKEIMEVLVLVVEHTPAAVAVARVRLVLLLQTVQLEVLVGQDFVAPLQAQEYFMLAVVVALLVKQAR